MNIFTNNLKYLSQIVTVLMLDGNSEIGAYLWSEIGHLIGLRHSFRSTAVQNLKSIYKYACFTSHLCKVLPSDTSTMQIIVESHIQDLLYCSHFMGEN